MADSRHILAYCDEYDIIFLIDNAAIDNFRWFFMQRAKVRFLFLNTGHFLDHLFMLIFASVAALRLTSEWGMTYAELIPYSTPAFIAFGVGALAAGWIADKWSRERMMVVFFIGIGVSSVLASFANNPIEIGLSLTLMGLFAAIYHPVGLAMVVEGRKNTGMPLAINGVYGNMGVACAALLTGFLIDISGWRTAFIIPGIASMLIGTLYLWFIRSKPLLESDLPASHLSGEKEELGFLPRCTLLRVFVVIFFTTALGGLIFQSTTFSLPNVFNEEFIVSASLIGWYSFLVFAVAAVAQLVVGYLVDNYSIRPIFATVSLLQAVLFFVMTQVNGAITLLIAIAFMLVVFGQIPINDVLVGRIARSEWRSRAYAIRSVITFSVMASAIPLIAWIHGNWGFSRLFELLVVSALLIFSATLLLPDTKQIVRLKPNLKGSIND
jgi:MFS family permease